MVTIKTPNEIAIMTKAGAILRMVIQHISAKAKKGVSLQELDVEARAMIERLGAEPAFLGYQPHGAKKAYPATICASVNAVAVHAVPTDYVLNEGDIVALDFGAKLDGYYTDAAVTIGIGKITAVAQKLIDTTKKALIVGIKKAKPGNHLGDIGYAISDYIVSRGFSVLEGLTGHGIGKELHEDPHVWNVGRPGEGLELQAGMVIAIEPMTAVGSGKILQLKDDSYVTADGSLSAHFEHTVAITESGPKILT